MLRRSIDPRSAHGASVWYAIFACVLTWPLVRHLSVGVPADLRDPLL
jgi:hypothetical protein